MAGFFTTDLPSSSNYKRLYQQLPQLQAMALGMPAPTPAVGAPSPLPMPAAPLDSILSSSVGASPVNSLMASPVGPGATIPPTQQQLLAQGQPPAPMVPSMDASPTNFFTPMQNIASGAVPWASNPPPVSSGGAFPYGPATPPPPATTAMAGGASPPITPQMPAAATAPSLAPSPGLGANLPALPPGASPYGPDTPPPALASKTGFMTEDPFGGKVDYEALLQFGLATMAAGGRPGATGLGSLGAGGLAAMQTVGQKRAAKQAVDMAEKKMDIEQTRFRAKIDLDRKQLKHSVESNKRREDLQNRKFASEQQRTAALALLAAEDRKFDRFIKESKLKLDEASTNSQIEKANASIEQMKSGKGPNYRPDRVIQVMDVLISEGHPRETALQTAADILSGPGKLPSDFKKLAVDVVNSIHPPNAYENQLLPEEREAKINRIATELSQADAAASRRGPGVRRQQNASVPEGPDPTGPAGEAAPVIAKKPPAVTPAVEPPGLRQRVASKDPKQLTPEDAKAIAAARMADPGAFPDITPAQARRIRDLAVASRATPPQPAVGLGMK